MVAVGTNGLLGMIAPAMAAGVKKISFFAGNSIQHEILLGPQVAAERGLKYV